MSRGWTCRRQAGGVPCRQWNNPRRKVCFLCGKPRPVRKKRAHMAALDPKVMSYEQWIELNGGEHCAICGRTRDQLPNPARRLDRDHDHKTGKPRGLLCREDNRRLKAWITARWLRLAAVYLEDRA